jgi:hypothetical protein
MRDNQKGTEVDMPSRNEVLDLACAILDVLEGEDVSVGVSALMTAMLEVLIHTSGSKAQLIGIVNDIQDTFNARHAAEAWDLQQTVVSH